MTKQGTKQGKLPIEFINFLDDAAYLRVRNGIDKKNRDRVRMMRAIARHPTLKVDLTKWKFIEEEKR